MENLPSDVFHHHILFDLPIKEIYRYCLASAANNNDYCNNTTFWRNYLNNKSHTSIQSIIKHAAEQKLFGFVKFVCENYEKINIKIDLRTIIYCYYYFAENNNVVAMRYLYGYIPSKQPGIHNTLTPWV